jgi:hypothetical protein
MFHSVRFSHSAAPGRRLASALLLIGFGASALLAADSPLPKAPEIVACYDQALGGRDAILGHNSSTMRGTIDIPQPAGAVKLPFVYFAAAPYLRVEKVTLPNGAGDNVNGFDGTTSWGFDGTTSWGFDPRTGPQVDSGDDVQSAKRDADFYYPLDELTWFKSMETVGVEDFEGRPCYHLHGINNWGKSNDHYYDRETGLLTAYEFQADPGLVHEIFSDWQKVDGVLVSMKQTVKVKSKEGDWKIFRGITYSSYTFNDVDPTVFAPPQPVRDLLARSKPPAQP